MSEDVVRCFAETCLAEPFHRLLSDDDDDSIDENALALCEVVFAGVVEFAQLSRDVLSEELQSLLTGHVLSTIVQRLPTPRQVCPTLAVASLPISII